MSFDNLSRIKTRKLNLALLILFTFLALVFSVFMPVLGLIGVALLPISTALLVIMGRVRDGIICAVLSCLILLLFDYIMAPVVMVLILSIAFIYRSAIEKDRTTWQTVLTVFLAFFGAVLLYVILFSVFYRVNFFTEIASRYNAYIDGLTGDPFISSYGSLIMVDSSQLDEVIVQTQSMLRFIPRIIPGILVVSFSVITILNYYFSFRIFKRYQIEVKPFLPFIKWDLPWYYIWGIIAGLILVLIPNLGGTIDGSISTMDAALDIMGYNLIIIFGMLYLVLGIAVLWGIFERFKLGFLWRIAVITFLWFFFAFALIVFPALGLIDIWANFRKLKRK